jgi:hypothetical protein
MLLGIGDKPNNQDSFKIFFESPLFHDTVVEILFAFDIERSIALGTEGGKEYSLIWISEFCLKDDEKGFMALVPSWLLLIHTPKFNSRLN